MGLQSGQLELSERDTVFNHSYTTPVLAQSSTPQLSDWRCGHSVSQALFI